MRIMITRVCISSVIVVLIAGLALNGYAQTSLLSNKGKTILQTVKKPETSLKSLSLLDPNRFTMKNQYMMSFSSVGGSGSMMGMFINSMEYRFNCPLIMRLKVAYQSKTGQLFGSKSAFTGHTNYQSGRVFIPSFDLVYKPWKNTTIGFHYRDYSSQYPSYYGNRGYSRYNYSPFMRY